MLRTTTKMTAQGKYEIYMVRWIWFGSVNTIIQVNSASIKNVKLLESVRFGKVLWTENYIKQSGSLLNPKECLHSLVFKICHSHILYQWEYIQRSGREKSKQAWRISLKLHVPKIIAKLSIFIITHSLTHSLPEWAGPNGNDVFPSGKISINTYHHTTYLSFFLHPHILRSGNFTLKSA